MNALNSFENTAIAARETLELCDRTARKYHQTAVEFLSSPEAIATYKTLWQVIDLLWAIAVWTFLATRDWCDRLVSESTVKLEVPATPVEESPVSKPAPVAVRKKRQQQRKKAA